MRSSNRKTWKYQHESINKGNSKTGIVKTPWGGKIEPTSIEGHNAAWKKAQKKPKNNINSEAINNIKPKRNPKRTGFVWKPEKVASSIISLNQKNTQKLNAINPNNIT
jgi:hypothetical protein